MNDINFLSTKEKEKKKKEHKQSSSAHEIEFYTPESKQKEKSAGSLISGIKSLITSFQRKRQALEEERALKNAQKIDKREVREKKEKMNKIHIEELVEKNALLKKSLTKKEKKEKKEGVTLPSTSKKDSKIKEARLKQVLPDKKQTPVIQALDSSSKDDERNKKKIEVASVKDTEGFGGLGVNLMPWEDPTIKRNQRIRVWSVAGVIVGVVVWGSMVRINNHNKEERVKGLEVLLVSIEEQLENIDAELLSQGSEVTIHQNRFIEVYKGLSVWSAFFTFLESNTHPDVYFTDLRVKGPEKMSIEAKAPDFVTAAQQWRAFETATTWIKDLEVASFSEVAKTGSEEKEVDFTFEFGVNTDVLGQNMQRETTEAEE